MLKVSKQQLRYCNDSSDGYTRVKKGKGYCYLDINKKPIVDKELIKRIKSLVIPPAWKNVWISPYDNGHLQATGLDDKGRKQYLYHPLWNETREKHKINRILAFGKVLPSLREAITADCRQRNLGKDRVSAIALSIMENTLMRAGNDRYRRENNSYGLTTLRSRHVKIEGQIVTFNFTGKKGKKHNIKLSNRSLTKRLRQVMEIPGQEVFQYYNDDQEICSLDSGDLNEYIQRHTGQNFTSKDFRTWYATLWAFKYLLELSTEEQQVKSYKKNLNACLDFVAKKLGNTRAVCRASYVCNDLIDAYLAGSLQSYLRKTTSDEMKSLPIHEVEPLLITFLHNLKKSQQIPLRLTS
ncbi:MULTISPECIES: DNA topoisomerase IB [Olivibacter]|uniref:DNA topoisomerase n=1 Tax=Olivibacter jilunii TaxID=985016 RepID=A0ABW6AXZ3_9SPHI